MKYYIAFSLGARVDLRSAMVWYQRINANLASRFLSEARATASRVRQNPYQFAIVVAKIRRALLRHFPYAIYYSVDHDKVFVISLVHQRQSERSWIQREYRPG